MSVSKRNVPLRDAWDETTVYTAIQKRYSDAAWCLLRNVRNTVGTAKQERYADAMALNMWPSRGMEIIGFEIKSLRSDWLSELSKPEKSDAIQQYCDRWYIAAGHEDIVRPGELPPTWGLMVPSGKSNADSKTLTVKVEAPKLASKEITKKFMLSLVRSAFTTANPPEVLQKQLDAEYRRGVAAGEKHIQQNVERQHRELEDLQRTVGLFEAASGVRITPWDTGKIGEAVKVVLSANVLQSLKWQRDQLQTILTTLQRGIEELDK